MADPYAEIEQLHQTWLDATEELEKIMEQWHGNWGSSELRDRYFEKQDEVLQLVQHIMSLRKKLSA